MKRLTLLILTLLPLWAFSQATSDTSFCGLTRTNSGAIIAVSSHTYDRLNIDVGGANSNCINIPDNSHDIIVTHCMLKNAHSSSGAIHIGANCTNITIMYNFIATSYRGVNVVKNGSPPQVAETSIHINYNRFYNICDVAGHGNGGGSSVQLNNVIGPDIQINHNDAYTDIVSADVGDIFSVYQSSGTSGSLIKVDSNCVRGGSTLAAGKSGVILGDVGGSYQEAIGNKMVNSGAQAGQVVGGTNCNMSNNYGFGVLTSYTLAGFVSGNFGGGTPSGNTMGGNHANWMNHATATRLDFWYSSGGGNPLPTGWATNVSDNSLNNSLLPDPLFNVSCSSPISPPVIAYSPNTYTLSVGQSLSINVNNTGGAASSYSVTSGALPPGISLNTTTGGISGTATGTYSTFTSTITGTNTSGSGSTNVTFTVNGVPVIPPHTTYPSPQTYTISNPIIPLSPNNTGGAVSSYSATLPSGLTINTATGVISGIPVVVVSNTYNVTAVNTAGSYIFPLVITVNAAPVLAPAIGYSPSSQTGIYGYVLANMNAANSGGAGTYSIAPSLPTGVSLNTSTGVISGIPHNVQSATNYTVTCTNGAGSSHATVTLTFNKAPLLLVATSLSKKPGQVNPTLKFTYSGLVNNDTSIATPPSLSTTANTSSPIGNYPINIFGASSTNYSFQYIKGTLTVSNGVFGIGKIAVIVNIY